MVLLLSVCCPPAPRIEEPFDGADDAGNRCSNGSSGTHSTPPVSPLSSVHLRNPGEKPPYFGTGSPGMGGPAAPPGDAARGWGEHRATKLMRTGPVFWYGAPRGQNA